MDVRAEQKLASGRILIVSLSFMAINLAWSVYNAFVPVFLDHFTTSTVLIGLIMTFDNLFGLVLQPYFGSLSDRTKSRFGRRTPFLMVGVPVAAVGMLLIPMGKRVGVENMLAAGKNEGLSFALLMVGAIILMNFAMSVYRAPAVAMMPDMTPSKKRSQANGLVNLMGGLGSVLAFSLGGMLFDWKESSPFILAAVLMVAALFALMAFHKEPEIPFEAEEEGSDGENLKSTGAALFSWSKGVPLCKSNRNLLFLLLSVFFWFCAYNGVETFFTLFARDNFGLTAGEGAKLLTFLSGSYLLSAVPAGLIGAKIGRKTSMVLGTVLAIFACLGMVLTSSPVWLPYLLVLAGVGVGAININSFPAVMQMSGRGESGKYTGFYYAFSFSASIASPLLFGCISDFCKTNSGLFYYALAMYLVGLLCILTVKKQSVESN